MSESDDPVLMNDWHPVATVDSLSDGALFAVRVLDRNIVVWRAGEELCAWRDRCVHRGTKLSLGKVLNGDCVQCPYHGWVYDRARAVRAHAGNTGADSAVARPG